MITVAGVEKGLTRKIVHLSGVRGYTDYEILNAALDAAGETRSSLFGTRVVRNDAHATVTLHTD